MTTEAYPLIKVGSRSDSLAQHGHSDYYDDVAHSILQRHGSQVNSTNADNVRQLTVCYWGEVFNARLWPNTDLCYVHTRPRLCKNAERTISGGDSAFQNSRYGLFA
jgi:hypothetical protein